MQPVDSYSRQFVHGFIIARSLVHLMCVRSVLVIQCRALQSVVVFAQSVVVFAECVLIYPFMLFFFPSNQLSCL